MEPITSRNPDIFIAQERLVSLPKENPDAPSRPAIAAIFVVAIISIALGIFMKNRNQKGNSDAGQRSPPDPFNRKTFSIYRFYAVPNRKISTCSVLFNNPSGGQIYQK
ncbi:hypothetical protein [Kushneria aurantia]|uniref:Uncharacterized protein n=1 Tax=Kushneria aurantia TaxID=504092 RepID=A0ABV6FZA2_9GAMM|nr:hypothetical protein [Kushneria aurantia]